MGSKLLEGMEFKKMLNKDRRLDVMEVYLDWGQRGPFFSLLSEAGNEMISLNGKRNNIAVETYYAIALGLLSHINRWSLKERIENLIDVDKLMRIDSFASMEEAVDYLHEISTALFDIHGEVREKQANTAIDSVKKYIDQHLGEDLSLVKLAEQVFLNASYLSRLFKQITGMKLSEYIESTRVRRAKELLQKGNIKIKDVARLVGYETAASFTRFFKKSTGCSPQEYRRKGDV